MSRITTRCSTWTWTTSRRIWKKQRGSAEKRSSRPWRFLQERLRGCRIPKATRSGCGKRRGNTSKLRSGEALEDAGGAHAAADAHGNHAVARIAALQFANDSGGEVFARVRRRAAGGRVAARCAAD